MESQSNALSSGPTGEPFAKLVAEVGDISRDRHAQALLTHAVQNLPHSTRSLRDLPALRVEKAQSAVIVSAGPSVHKQKSIFKILESNYRGTIIAVDGSMISCLKAGLVPDYVLTLDPHETRIVRWYGDPDFEEHTRNDDYFQRQDLDEEFRKKP
jgi:hypothetical protein